MIADGQLLKVSAKVPITITLSLVGWESSKYLTKLGPIFVRYVKNWSPNTFDSDITTSVVFPRIASSWSIPSSSSESSSSSSSS